VTIASVDVAVGVADRATIVVTVGFLRIYVFYISASGTAVAQWLKCCATNRKVAGSIPDGVTGIFH